MSPVDWCIHLGLGEIPLGGPKIHPLIAAHDIIDEVNDEIEYLECYKRQQK